MHSRILNMSSPIRLLACSTYTASSRKLPSHRCLIYQSYLDYCTNKNSHICARYIFIFYEPTIRQSHSESRIKINSHRCICECAWLLTNLDKWQMCIHFFFKWHQHNITNTLFLNACFTIFWHAKRSMFQGKETW